MKIRAMGDAVQYIFGIVVIIGMEILIFEKDFFNDPGYIWFYIFACIMYAPFLWLSICSFVTMGRTLEMDKEGCTVSFFWYKRKYKWDELCVKQVIKYTKFPFNSHGREYYEGAVFAPYKIEKAIKNPVMYKDWIPHLSFFFVNFSDPKKKLRSDGWYEVREEEFLSKMQEWGVELEDMREKK